MLSVAGADHIITMDLHASQIQVSGPPPHLMTRIHSSLCRQWEFFYCSSVDLVLILFLERYVV